MNDFKNNRDGKQTIVGIWYELRDHLKANFPDDIYFVNRPDCMALTGGGSFSGGAGRVRLLPKSTLPHDQIDASIREFTSKTGYQVEYHLS